MCFGLGWLEAFLVWAVIVGAVVALLRLLVTFVIPRLGLAGDIAGFVVKAITIVLWAIVLVACIYFVFDIIACLAPSMRLPR